MSPAWGLKLWIRQQSGESSALFFFAVAIVGADISRILAEDKPEQLCQSRGGGSLKMFEGTSSTNEVAIGNRAKTY